MESKNKRNKLLIIIIIIYIIYYMIICASLSYFICRDSQRPIINLNQPTTAIPSFFIPSGENDEVVTNDTIVSIPKVGQVGGLINKFKDEPTKSYYQYKGIPYAERAPRFTLAKAKSEWTGIHNGKVEGKVCPQIGVSLADTDEENCLVLTISTTQDPNKVRSPLSVLVYFYAGTFIQGSVRTVDFDPEPLLHEEGIIVVQVQYRLGALAWITDGKHIPKNIGLKDAFTGLKWVHDNIAAFGGDASRLTIWGESSGAIITSYLYQSRRAQGLFSKAILQSGTSLNVWSFQSDPTAAFQRTAKYSGCHRPTVEEQVECLRNISATSLKIANAVILEMHDMLFGHVIDGLSVGVILEDANDPEAIVIESPLHGLTNGTIASNASVLISITSEESLTFSVFLNVFRTKSNEALVTNGMHATNKAHVGKLIKEHYGDGIIGWIIMPSSVLTRFASDLFYNNGYLKYIKVLQPRLQPSASIYCMVFNYSSPLGLVRENGLVGHADDNYYAWRHFAAKHEDLKAKEIPARAYEMRKALCKLFANFAKDGNPTPVRQPELQNLVWPAVSDSNAMKCLEFNDEFKLITNPKYENYPFWDNLYNTYGNQPTVF